MTLFGFCIISHSDKNTKCVEIGTWSNLDQILMFLTLCKSAIYYEI